MPTSLSAPIYKQAPPWINAQARRFQDLRSPMLTLLTSLLLTGCALLPGATIVSVGGGAEDRVPVQVQQVMGVSWSQSATFEDVSILAPIGGDCGFDGRSACGSMYLTNAVGPDTTRENVLGSVSLFGRPSGMNTIFTGLTLPPGTYYLLLFNGSIETAPYWSSTSNPEVSLAEGVLLNQAFASAILGANPSFPPASPVTPLRANLQFLVTAGPPTTVPEPSPAIPAAVGSLLLLLGSRKLSCLQGNR